MLARALLYFKENEVRQQRTEEREAEKARKKKLTGLEAKYDSIAAQIPDAKAEIAIAEQFFNHAESVFVKENELPDENGKVKSEAEKDSYIDVAILRMEAARKRYSVLIRELKEVDVEIKAEKARLEQSA